MARSIDEIIALHIGGVALEMCKQVKKNEDLRERLNAYEREASERVRPTEDTSAKQEQKG